MEVKQSRVHHYVPRWYQRRFLKTGQYKYHYLDLHPGIVYSNGVRHERNALLNWGPDRCFYRNDLYTLDLGTWSSDEIERRFFGAIDSRGRSAVEVFGNYDGLREGVPEAFHSLVEYMGAQRFRTPRGLEGLRATGRLRKKNEALVFMQRLFLLHGTMWAEGIWEVVRARRSLTKFIVTDEPVTFFNRRGFPRAIPYPDDVDLGRVGTRTIFPLGIDACPIITHLQLVRNPWMNPMLPRANARSFEATMRDLRDTHFGRELEEDEVLRINLIMKKRATRYIAAAEKDWLYPERRISTGWAKLDDDWFLLPNLYKIPFSGEIIVGYKDGTSWAMDEHGRHPGNPSFRDREMHDREWETREKAKKEWAKRRVGRSVAHVDKFSIEERSGDGLMQDYLASVGLAPPRVKPESARPSTDEGEALVEKQVGDDRTDQEVVPTE
jgi:uncharacterized protein DUF4238